jgi:hypothetical protein
MSTTELSTFSSRNRNPRMPSRPPSPPPAAAAAAEDQVVPQGPPEEPAQPSDAPGPMRMERRAREDRRARESTTPPHRPSQSPAARHGPQPHDVLIPAWGVPAVDIWFECLMCTKTTVHSAVVCGQCGVRPACCRCMILMEGVRHSEGRCPYCRYTGRH